jgi:GT2 family glycosyltransferase/glycosyltransferase involved in cell wall biosynthesis
MPGAETFIPRFYHGDVIRFHLPLFYDLVLTNKPRLIVTVGFGEGDAHFTFCQAAQEQRLKCRCVAVRRDDPKSEKDDEAWQKGRAYGEEFYWGLSQFVSGPPDKAAKEFAKQGVDLLLIDDCDSGSTVRKELAAWKSNLASNAIVLFHGTKLERDDSPVAAWSRFVSHRPHAEFHDGAGLGIAAAGNAANAKRFVSGLGKLAELYRLAAARIDAQVRAARSSRENISLQTQQIWLDSVLLDRWRAQEIMDHQARALTDLEGKYETIQRDRAKAQEVMDAQAAQIRTLREDREKAQEVMDNQAGQLLTQARHLANIRDERDILSRDFEALSRDRAKAQLVMDAQGEQLKQFGATTSDLSSQLEKLKAQVKEQKQVLKSAKEACRKKGRCFELPRKRRPLSERLARELARGPRNLRKLLASKETASPQKKTKEPVLNEAARYRQWIAEHEPDSTALDRQRQEARRWNNGPRISLLVPVFNPAPQFLEEMLASAAAQTYENWEICLVDASPNNRRVSDVLKRWEAREPRLRVQRLERNLGISENSNRALEQATGDFIALLDQDDLLSPFALFELARASRANPDADLFYSDEDRWSEAGERTNPFFKPDWSPELLYSCMYLGHLSAYRRSLANGLGGFRKEFDLSQDYDLALRATERAKAIHHIPHVLYHWREHRESGSRGGKPEARKSNLAALAEAMRRRNLPAEVIEYSTANRARLKVTQWPRVSVIIPTDSPTRLQECLRHLPSQTEYPDWEIVIVTNSSLANSLGNTRTKNAALRTINFDEAFNFSAKSNAGAEVAGSERLIFFNDDVEATQTDWIQELIEPLENPEVGAVSPKMLYASGRIQHAGLVTGVRGLIGTAFHQQAADTTMHANFAQSMRDVSALSGACLAMRREDFVRVGGFDELNTPVSHSDVDLCFRVREAGWRCVYTPFVTLKHTGHVSIGQEEKTKTAQSAADKSSIYLLKRWSGYTTHDPFYSDNMRDWLFADSPTPIKMSGQNNPVPPEESRDVLFVSHDLSSSGAPVLLLHLATWCKANGIFPVVIAPESGALYEKFQRAGITTIVDPLVETGHDSFRRLLRDFDCVVANTIRAWPAVRAAHSESVPVMWWLHETLAGDHFLRKDADLRAALPLADFIFTPTERTSAVYRPFTDHPVRKLRSGIPDIGAGNETAPIRRDQVRFLLLGSMEPRKGQDIFVEAVRQLPRGLQSKAEFKMVGRTMVPEFAAKVAQAANGLTNLSIDNEVSYADALELLRQCDVLVCASRDEAMPMTIMEAMSLGKAVLSTKVGGVSEVLRDGENALVVRPENAAELSAALERLSTEPDLIDKLGRNARAAYEENFTLNRFGRDFKTMLEEVLANYSAVSKNVRDVDAVAQEVVR